MQVIEQLREQKMTDCADESVLPHSDPDAEQNDGY